jgi:outer membrane protein OmpA-like peptidoglycan-associated protein
MMEVTYASRSRGSLERVALLAVASILAGTLVLSGCAKSGAPETKAKPVVTNPNSLHGTGGHYLIDPNAQIRWSYASMPTPAPSGKPNYLLKSFLFESGVATLNGEARGALSDLIEMLGEKPTVRVLCLGLCDGNQEKVNAQNLGMNRASAARKFLLDHGIDKDRAEMASFGSSVAEAPPEESIGQRLDRKVEIWLLSE